MIELEKTYDHSKVEEKIYKIWEESGFFNPDNLPDDRKEPYTIIMPPPNANAPMHLGHALFVTIEDILIRYQRMQGKKTLWQPGTDHAGFETQVVFEKKLEKEGRSRFKMQREEFYKEIWDFVQSNKHITENGLRRLGASCDWDRNIFTLDPEIVKIVYETFKKMYADGLVYRGDRIGNWCFKHQTALSDLETKYEERVEPFYYFKYGPFIIGTSRPETKFGDKYVVMHPNDKRYAQYKNGDTFTTEWINGPIKATVIKDEAVDMEFGSGVMTITPWHDPVDFDLAQKHKLDKEQIIDKFGKLLPIAGEFAGTKTAIARPLIVEKLKSKGLLEKIDEKYKHNVQVCYKCGTIIEPQIIPQWFVAMTKPLPDGRPSLRDMAVKAIQNKEVEIVTEKFEKIFMHWMENLRDWPISRQIWWGIPIPVWYDETGKIYLPKNIEITLVRHGESEDNAKKIYTGYTAALTETGKKHAEDLAQKFNVGDFTHIITSDLERAIETATPLSKKLGLPIENWPELKEVNGGKLVGTPRIKGVSILEGAIKNNTGETLENLESRAKEAVKKLSGLPDGSKVLMVGHNSFLSIVKATMDGKDKEKFLSHRKEWHLDNGGILHTQFTVKPEGNNLTQDPDTFDTWFSSGQWPYATLMANDAKRNLSVPQMHLGHLPSKGENSADIAQAGKTAEPPSPFDPFGKAQGHPEQSRGGEGRAGERSDFQTYFPTQVMETGWDILFFWVARMIMMSYYRTGKPPFEKVYLHGLVRDKDRQKMSKSKGNVIDPLGVIDTYGCDALRFALIFSTAAGNDIPLAEDKIKGMKHFANKLWNIARYVLANTSVFTPPLAKGGLLVRRSFSEGGGGVTDADKEILTRLDQTIKNVTTHLDNFRLHEAAQDIYQFTWHEFADIYIEASKNQLADEKLKANTQTILNHSLITVLKLLHPFMPFITEELWKKLGEAGLLMKKDLLIISAWPKI